MARKCKCFVTGAIGDTESFIKGANGKYFCSFKVYNEYCRTIEQRKEIIRLIAEDILGYQTGQVFPGYLVRGLKDFDFYDTEVILRTLQKNQSNLKYYMQAKDFRDDTAKLCYIYGALKNNINSVYKDWLKEKSNKRQEDIASDSIDVEMLISGTDPEQQVTTKQKNKDISSWLGDE